uniref:SWIM-type domain-containing protein n=1 Tax=Ditylenchus dipsaci TaxID=166011 RepID=A0A915ENU5_9BILA
MWGRPLVKYSAQPFVPYLAAWSRREDYRSWYYRYAPAFAMFSISTKNGLEGTNKMIKDNFTHRELLGLSPFVLVVEQFTHGWSIDPERKKPLKVPTIPKNPNSNLRKAVEKLREKSARLCKVYTIKKLMWTELLQAETTNDLDWTYSSWQRYQILRNFFYVLKKYRVYLGFLCCNCPVGIKDGLCEHSLLLMEIERLIDPLPRPLEPRRKRGLRKKVGWALERL